MPKCRFCRHDNPTGIDRCQSCGAWLEQAVPSGSAGQQPSSGVSLENANTDPNSLEGQVLALMQGQKKIDAIKLYRQQTGTGLKEAKDAVEALAVRHGVSPKQAGCAGMVLLMVLASAIIGIGAWVLPG